MCSDKALIAAFVYFPSYSWDSGPGEVAACQVLGVLKTSQNTSVILGSAFHPTKPRFLEYPVSKTCWATLALSR